MRRPSLASPKRAEISTEPYLLTTTATMQKHVFSEVQRRGHEQVCFFYNSKVGLKAIVAIHNSVLGPALGGCRMRLYEDESQALDDVLRLSEGMTFKSSLAGLDLGGGKACIIADPKLVEGRKELFAEFGRCLNRLAGRYITAEDMGTSVDDIMHIREQSAHVAGIAPGAGGGGDPSPWTARGVFKAMLAACERKFGTQDLKGKRVAVQGIGHVGVYLVEHLVEAGAKVVACDPNQDSCQQAHTKFGIAIVELEQIYDEPCDVFSPNAIGQTVNSETLKRLDCSIICGGANNQLSGASVYETLISKKVLYCPDFVVNAGGVINVGAELIPGGYNRSWVEQKVDAIQHTTDRVLDESERRGRFPELVAVELAKERISQRERALQGE